MPAETCTLAEASPLQRHSADAEHRILKDRARQHAEVMAKQLWWANARVGVSACSLGAGCSRGHERCLLAVAAPRNKISLVVQAVPTKRSIVTESQLCRGECPLPPRVEG